MIVDVQVWGVGRMMGPWWGHKLLKPPTAFTQNSPSFPAQTQDLCSTKRVDMWWYSRILKGWVWIVGSYYSPLWPDPGTWRTHDGGREGGGGAPLGGWVGGRVAGYPPSPPLRGILWTPSWKCWPPPPPPYDQPQSHVTMYTLWNCT